MSQESGLRSQQSAVGSREPDEGTDSGIQNTVPVAAVDRAGEAPARKVRAATVWLDGCSGCHMSFLDMDERLVEIVRHVQMVYTPLIDLKEYPDGVDVALVEGAVSSEEDLEKIHRIRQKTAILVALGDCAITANVPSMRNAFRVDDVYARGYVETATQNPGVPTEVVPRLLPKARPIHEYVPVDIYLQGCPPPADVIYELLVGLLAGHAPDLTTRTRFGR